MSPWLLHNGMSVAWKKTCASLLVDFQDMPSSGAPAQDQAQDQAPGKMK